MEEDEEDSMKVWEVGDFGTRFPPPPPRPPHLNIPEFEKSSEELECDLCSWARPSSKIVTSIKDTGSLNMEWITTLVIVAIASAAVTAIVMITLPKCWRRIMMSFNNGDRNAVPKSRSHSTGEVNCVVENEIALTERPDRSKKCHLQSTQNHYTHIERELNRTPAFINAESSNPSSAYYSELSAGDLTYETVDLHAFPKRLLPRVPLNTTQID